MTMKEMVLKYIQKTERVFGEIKLASNSMGLDEEKIESVIETAKHYLEDAKYYEGKNKLETGLASVAYCEGLLDALRLLGVVEFSW